MTLTKEQKRIASEMYNNGESIDKIRQFLVTGSTQAAAVSPQVGSVAKSDGGNFLSILKKPEELSREGLTLLTDTLTPSRADIESGRVGVPGIAARTAGETLAEVAPSFVSPEAIATSGLLGAGKIIAPAARAAGRSIAGMAESTSGLSYKTPGVLVEAANDPTLLFGKGRQAAKAIYQGLKNEAQISPDLARISQPRAFIRKALQFADDGSLTPDEALEARKALDTLGDKVPDIFRVKTRRIFDAIAKGKFAEADKAYARAVKSEALRQFFSLNKTGTPSIVKGGIQTVLPPTLPLFSPLAQGIIATGVGAGRRALAPIIRNSRSGALVGSILSREDE